VTGDSNNFHRCPAGAEAIRHYDFGLTVPLHCFSQESQGCFVIPLLDDIRFQDLALVIDGPPEIMNTDQGSQFTGSAWITTLTDAGVRVSMDGRGRYLDNIFIERLWRSLKQEANYLEEIQDGFQARRIIRDWMAFYNTNRPHSALEHRTPREPYRAGRDEKLAA